MSNLNRKEFIRLGTWAFVATLLPVGRISSMTTVFDSTNPKSTNEDYIKALELAKTAKDFFYKKDFNKAEQLYLECIRLAPRSICFYDNLDNVYGAQGDTLSSVLLYENGLKSNPTVVSFYDRAARSLVRLEIGRKILARNYQIKINSTSLLKDAELLYLTAIKMDDSKVYLKQELNRLNRKIEISQLDEKIRILQIKQEKKKNKEKFKLVFQNKTNQEIEQLISRSTTKKRVKLYGVNEIEQQNNHIQQQQKKYYRLLLSRELGDEKSLSYAENLFNLDVKDTQSLELLKKVYYKNNRYFELIGAREKFAQKKQSLYGFLGVMDAIEQAFKKRQVAMSDLIRAENIGKELMSDWMLIPKTEVDVSDKLAKNLVLQSKFEEAKSIIKRTIERVATTESAAINKLVYRYAKISFDERDYRQAEQILLIGVKETDTIIEDLQFLKIRVDKKSKQHFKSNIVLYYLLHQTYVALNNMQLAEVISEKIRMNNPNDQFILTRK